ncbi:MAG: hypothetical protein AABW79_00175 [Nanoarchaeota archaeon]
MKINDNLYQNEELRGWIRDLKECGYNQDERRQEIIKNRLVTLYFPEFISPLSLLAGITTGVCGSITGLMGLTSKMTNPSPIYYFAGTLLSISATFLIVRFLGNKQYDKIGKIAKTAENNRHFTEHGHTKRGIRNFKLDEL